MIAPLSVSGDVRAAPERPQLAPGFWRRALRHRSFVTGGTLSLLVLCAALLSLVWTPWSAYEINVASRLRPLSAAHWLGTDVLGRDIVSLLLVGARSTIMVGIIALGILAEAALSYLGLGTQPPQPSWGRMLNDAQTLLFQSPMLAVYPGAAIAVAVLGLNLLGDGLRDLLDPRLARER